LPNLDGDPEHIRTGGGFVGRGCRRQHVDVPNAGWQVLAQRRYLLTYDSIDIHKQGDDMVGEAKYQVFVSSTYTDLVTERQAVMFALLQLGALPAGMELFPAADDEAWVLIKRVIDESDYYLLVIGGRYGSLEADGVSYTEKEYNYAVAQRKPVMAFLHQHPEKLPFEVSEGDPAVREKLLAFRKRVEGAKHVKFWTSADDLAGKIALSFPTFTRSYPSAGWIRGDAGDSPETLRKLASAQERVAEMEALLHNRAVQPPASAEGLADSDERLEFDVSIEIKLLNLTAMSNTARTQWISWETTISWNEIISALGPLMLDEASQGDLSARFRQAVATASYEDAREVAIGWLRQELKASEILGYQKGKPSPRIQFTSKVISRESDFETALLQLEALGIIERGSKKRPIADHFTYWTLTPWGRTRLTRLRAVRAGATRPPDQEEIELPLDGDEAAG
jgi:Domain of unknown function (DUF4062)